MPTHAPATRGRDLRNAISQALSEVPALGTMHLGPRSARIQGGRSGQTSEATCKDTSYCLTSINSSVSAPSHATPSALLARPRGFYLSCLVSLSAANKLQANLKRWKRSEGPRRAPSREAGGTAARAQSAGAHPGLCAQSPTDRAPRHGREPRRGGRG